MADKSEQFDVTATYEQLRYRVPGGIGTYIRGLHYGLTQLQDNELSVGWNDSKIPVAVLTRMWQAHIPTIRNTRLIHATSFRLPPTSKPLTVMVHDILWREYPDTFPQRGIDWHNKALHQVLKRAEAIIVPSQRTRLSLVELGANVRNIHVIPHGIDHFPPADLLATNELLAQHEVGNEFLLTVGTIEPRKNLAKVITAVDQANESFNTALPLVVAGPQGWSKSLPPSENVIYLGSVEPEVLAGLYERATAFIYAPLAEGFGFPPLEAMSLKTPVIASPIPSVGEVAYLVDPANVDDITKAIFTVVTDENVRARLSQAGSAHAEKFRWKTNAQQHVNVWKEILNR
jgi:glycosyltransferase involved in cell wall biosynthesis